MTGMSQQSLVRQQRRRMPPLVLMGGVIVILVGFLRLWGAFPTTEIQSKLTLTTELQRGLPGLDVDVLWQHPAKKPRAILFVAHGCNHAMTDWFSPTAGICEDCIGLPEERAIVATALAKNLVVCRVSGIDIFSSMLYISVQ